MPLFAIDVRKQLGTILEKMTSARFIIAILIIWTISYTTMKAMDLLQASLADKEKFLMVKEIFIYMMGIVSGIAGSVIALYFTRSDRKSEPNGDQQVAPK